MLVKILLPVLTAAGCAPACLPTAEPCVENFAPGVVQVKYENELGCDLSPPQTLTVVFDAKSYDGTWGGDASLAWAHDECDRHGRGAGLARRHLAGMPASRLLTRRHDDEEHRVTPPSHPPRVKRRCARYVPHGHRHQPTRGTPCPPPTSPPSSPATCPAGTTRRPATSSPPPACSRSTAGRSATRRDTVMSLVDDHGYQFAGSPRDRRPACGSSPPSPRRTPSPTGPANTTSCSPPDAAVSPARSPPAAAAADSRDEGYNANRHMLR